MQLKRTRRRPTKSCLECNRRKQKCNRDKPCNHCIERSVEQLCVYQELAPRPRASRNQLLEHEGERSSWSAPDTDDSGELDESQLEALEGLGYGPQNSTGVMKEVLTTTAGISLTEARKTPSTTLPDFSSELRESFPSRQTTDFLRDMFLRRINGIYELIHSPSFMPRYNSWWKEFDNHNDVDDEAMDFALLILRICVLSLQCLPHPDYPTAKVFDVSPLQLRRKLYALANTMERPQHLARNRKRSLSSIQHQFYHICYLKNNSQIRECWFLLGQTVNDAHSIEIHLEKPGHYHVDGLEMELRRRTFWSLYIWDKFMCTFLGRWPLIPEGHYDVDLPHDNLQAIITSPFHLTPFTDRLYHIKLAQFMQSSMSTFSWKRDQHNPHVIEKLTRKMEDDIINHLPPAYRLTDPDTSWDSAEPAIPEKRQSLHLLIYATKAGLYRAFIDPWKALSKNKSPPPTESPADESFTLSLNHHRTLIDSACRAIAAITTLYEITGGVECNASERFFVLPVALMETLACLGLCLLSARLAGAKDALYPGTQREAYEIFFHAFDLLEKQKGGSKLAKRGVKILEGLHGTLASSSGVSPSSDGKTEGSSGSGLGSTPGNERAGEPSRVLGEGDGCFGYGEGGDLELPAWMPSFMESPDSSWFFDEAAGREVTSMDMYYNAESLDE